VADIIGTTGRIRTCDLRIRSQPNKTTKQLCLGLPGTKKTRNNIYLSITVVYNVLIAGISRYHQISRQMATKRTLKMAQKFTAKYLESIKSPGRGQKIYVDELPPLSAVTGQLCLKVGKNTKTFFVQYRFEGRRKQLSIGKYPGRSLGEARKLAADKLTLLDKGIDPKCEKEAVEQDYYFKNLWERYIEKVERDGISSLANATLIDRGTGIDL